MDPFLFVCVKVHGVVIRGIKYTTIPTMTLNKLNRPDVSGLLHNNISANTQTNETLHQIQERQRVLEERQAEDWTLLIQNVSALSSFMKGVQEAITNSQRQVETIASSQRQMENRFEQLEMCTQITMLHQQAMMFQLMDKPVPQELSSQIELLQGELSGLNLVTASPQCASITSLNLSSAKAEGGDQRKDDRTKTKRPDESMEE